jgi:hypothetical protein
MEEIHEDIDTYFIFEAIDKSSHKKTSFMPYVLKYNSSKGAINSSTGPFCFNWVKWPK